jgi:hypothetical protein
MKVILNCSDTVVFWIVPTVWYLELFRQCGILNCSDSVVFWIVPTVQKYNTVGTIQNTTLSEQLKNTTLSEQLKNTTLSEQFKIPHCGNNSKMPHCRNNSKIKYQNLRNGQNRYSKTIVLLYIMSSTCSTRHATTNLYYM